MNFIKKLTLFVAFFSIVLWSCIKQPTINKAVSEVFQITQTASESKELAAAILEKTSIKVADGLKINLWATDSLAVDPIAISINSEGSVFLTRTNRQKNSEFDIRGHRDWMTESTSFQTMEDRRAFLRRVFAPENSEDNSWLKDLNKDGVHDWRDLAVEKEEIWKIEDTDGDGMADQSTLVLQDFNEEITDVAGALLVRDNDAFVGLGPDLWRLEDTNKDGLYDKKTSISHGYAVHIGFGGHGMSGLIEGPDGKIYWGIGDIGASLIDQTGKKHHYPNQGIIVRCNPDGSNFEVFSQGHRNTHEFVFDELGNLISSDNDGDQPSERERLVHIVEGSDSGWRSNWQYGKYTDPKNNSYRVWMAERLSVPRWDGQAAYIIPPIQNYHNGPTGMIYNPGTALSPEWKNKYFLVEFTGTPSGAKVWSFGLKQKGASFILDKEESILSGVLATGIRFGPDGAMYIADWVKGWTTKNYGRIWKLDSDKGLTAKKIKTKELIQSDYSTFNASKLTELLDFEDQRVRQKAQFELVKRNDIKSLEKANSNATKLGKIHAIWGIGQLMETNKTLGQALIKNLESNDTEIVAQTCKIMGQYFYGESSKKLIELLSHKEPRVQFYAAEALGRIKETQSIEPILNMLEVNADKDIYLRHAGVLALSRIGAESRMIELASSSNESLKLAAVLVLRKLQSEGLKNFLNDKNEYLLAEVARAINDDFSVESLLPDLANLLSISDISSEPIIRRAINACVRVGGTKELALLKNYITTETSNMALRSEAIEALGTWAEPSVLDRVDGRYRGVIKRDIAAVQKEVSPMVASLLKSNNEETVNAVVKMVSNLKLESFNSTLAAMFNDKASTATTKSILLEGLANLNYANIGDLVSAGMKNSNKKVRTTALGMIGKLNLSPQTLLETTEYILANGSNGEQQKIISSLTGLPLASSEPIFVKLLEKLEKNELDNNLKLELTEAIENTESKSLIDKMASLTAGKSLMETYSDVLYGGDVRQGRKLFMSHEAAQCVRCHQINKSGGTVGPDLTEIGSVLSREQILQALIEPNARLAPGYGSVSLTLNNGQEVFGVIASETEEELIITTSDAEPTKVQVSRIKTRENYPSGMPAMTSMLTKREIRNLVEYVSNLKK